MDATTTNAPAPEAPPPLNRYTLDQAAARLGELLDASEGEVTPEVGELIDRIDRDAPEVVDRIVDDIEDLSARAEATKRRAAALYEAARRLEARADGLRSLLTRLVLRLEPAKRKLKGRLYSAWVQRSGTPSYRPAAGWDAEMIARRYPHLARVKTELDPKACRAAAEAGELPELVVPTYSEHLRVSPAPRRGDD